ncbi:MAG TPA: hypothetical protein VE954_13635 [Oligoflexus sp.]|uniref:hypothetical protein n=1 Tax=Oligoflexus sp. TaxID=1971216 RepID=UPI002D371EF9|nr:hypothetical protein [Oligoflexus sp.]HYX34141.1 hypothetical protein [Oligoflexus sp.]
MKAAFASVATLCAVATSSLCFGQDSRPSSKDLHEYSRAIAFGSALMVTDGGGDQTRWKAVEAIVECPTSPAYPSPPIGKPADPASFAGGSNGCTASVHFVTNYEFKECPNGRVYVLRSGEGVFVLSAAQGSFFGWQEAASCEVSSPSNPSEPYPEPGPAPSALNSQLSRDKDRPLDFINIQRTMR